MRCKRCHAVISEGRKACPNCGTLIRKKRGSITLSARSGVKVNPVMDWLGNLFYRFGAAVRKDGRILILTVSLPLLVLGIVLLIVSGAKSCSCSCEGDLKTAAYEMRENSREPSLQIAVGDSLYYIADGSIMCRSADESYRSIYDSVSATDLQSDGEYLYFREDNCVKRIKTGASEEHTAETVLDYTSEQAYSLGYFIAEGDIYYYLRENGKALTVLYSDETLVSGEVSNFGYMNGRVYYTLSDSDVSGVYSMKADGSDDKLVIGGISDYQLGGGYIYAVKAEGDEKYLTRFDENGNGLVRWDISALTGGEMSSFAANDTWLCFAVTTESGSAVYKIEHNSESISTVFAYSSAINLTGVSGDWYAFESGTETERTYSIRNSKNGKSAL